MASLPGFAEWILASFAVSAAIFDLIQRRIPNWLALTALLTGLGLNLLAHQLTGFWQALTGIGLACLIYFPLYLLRVVGGGDVKLMVALGALVGPGDWLVIFLFGAIIGAIIAAAIVVMRGWVVDTVRNLGCLVYELIRLRPPYKLHQQLDISGGRTLPHAASVALGSLAFLLLRHSA